MTDIEMNKRYYHAIFAWCTVTLPPAETGKVLVDLEADEISYYVMGKGRVYYERDKKTGRHVLYTPVTDLFESKEAVPDSFGLRISCYAPKLTFWKKK